MSFYDNGIERAAALCVGSAAVAFGAPPSGALEAIVGLSGLIGFVLGRASRFGPECARVRGRIRAEVLESYRHLISGSDGDWQAAADLSAADQALHETLNGCVIDRERLAAAAVSPGGFPGQAVRVVMEGLAAKRPDLFGSGMTSSLAYRYASDVVRIGMQEAVRNVEYYRALEPALTFEMAHALGQVRVRVDALFEEQSRQGDVLAQQTAILEQLMTHLGGQAASTALMERQQRELDATRGELLGLLRGILDQQVPADRIEEALRQAHGALQANRQELDRLRGLSNEVPSIGPLLAEARAALQNAELIDLDRARTALRQARLRYAEEVRARRAQEAQNLSRLLEAEADLARAQSRYLEAADLYAQAEAELPPGDRHRRASLNVAIGHVLASHGGIFPGLAALLDAAKAYGFALESYTRAEMPADWAATQNNLGNVLLTLGERQGGGPGLAALNDAVAAYRLALEIYARAEMLAGWATTQNNLGAALRTLGERQGGASGLAVLNAAVAAYRLVLEIRTRAEMPADWAATQNNLGNALLTLGERQGGASGLAALNDAVAAYRLALEIRTRAEMPADWAATQNNLGNALRTLGERQGGASGLAALNDAVAAYRLALDIYTRAEMPAGWATTQNNLGNALRTLGERQGGASGLAALSDAVAAYRLALEIRTRAEMPADWAATQNNLGNVLLILGERQGGALGLTALNDAVAAYRLALEIYTRAEMPAGWAVIQSNLGAALQTLGERQGGASGLVALNDAVAAYRLALEIRTRAEMPVGWAATECGLGSSLIVLGIEVGDASMVEQGIRAIELAGEVLRENDSYSWRETVLPRLKSGRRYLGRERGVAGGS